MKKSTNLFSGIAFLIVALITNPASAQTKMKAIAKSTSTINGCALTADMRKLWEDNIMWTRNVILCLVGELHGTDQAVKRLLQNQVNIGDAIKPYYGEAAGKKLTELLYAHINISVEVIKYAKSENASALDEANTRWNTNADEISEFFCKENPHIKLVDMKVMMSDHLKLTTDEIMQRIKKNYDADIVSYDKVHDEILKMSDMLSESIVKQFPEKFNTVTNKKIAVNNN